MTKEQAIATINRLHKLCIKMIDSVKEQYATERRVVLNEWAKEKARFKVGDIIQCGSTIICVDFIVADVDFYNTRVYAIYKGPQMTNKLVPRKNGGRDYIVDDGLEIKLLRPANNT